MPYDAPSDVSIAEQLAEISEVADLEPAIGGPDPLERLRWWVGLGPNYVQEAWYQCPTSGPIPFEQLEQVAAAVRKYAASTLRALRGYASSTQNTINVVVPTVGRLDGMVNDYVVSTKQYRETEAGNHVDQVLLEQFLPPITAGSVATLGSPSAERLFSLGLDAVGSAATFLAALKDRPLYEPPYG